ncbi:MAG TPA: heavy metal translocating P-type ATPase [Acidobacteriaceae bacterium]|jgi:Cu+-exporting ATPase|nr:heavy metal translocating P-type ATPase [Acidobacteriaceae bacterium]
MSATEIDRAEKAAGSGAEAMRTVTLPVTGMTCAACQSHVERALRETAGVREASVNLLTNSARVSFDTSLAKPENLIASVRDAGYDAELPAETGEPAGDQAADEGPLRARAFYTLAAGVLVVLLMNAHQWVAFVAPILWRVPPLALDFTMLAVTLAGMVWGGGIIYRQAWSAAVHRSTNMNTLVALGTGAAFAYSVVATVAPQVFVRNGLQPDVYYDAVLLILGFLLLGRWLDARAKRRTLDALHAFAALQPRWARILRDGAEVEVPLAQVAAGDVVILRPGERVPVDGVVLKGETSIDESLITGESVPVPRQAGDRVIGGSLNFDGALEYRATSVGAESVLGQMMRLVEEAQSSRAPLQQLADRVSAVFVPVVLGLAAVTFAIWILAGGGAGRAFAVSVAVLVIACPCAMGLAVPAALTVAIGRGAQLGVLFKGGESLERLARIDTVVLDKTGTLTEGKPEVVAIRAISGSEDEVLALAAALERRSEHPLARAILQAAEQRGMAAPAAEEVRAIPGKGIVGVVRGVQAAAGNAALLRELGVAVDSTAERAGDQPGTTVMYVVRGGKLAGVVEARDTLRASAVGAVAGLRRLGIRTAMLTGDTRATAEAVARAAGIDEVWAGLLPEEKLAKIRELQKQGRRVAMAGDGINDAAAISQADAGLAMGTGADLAREAGDAILLHGEPGQILDAVLLARRALRTMRQNLGWAFGYNLLGIPIAAGALYPAFGILLSPAIASAAMALSSVSVLANSLRLRNFAPR